jgi:predicted TPR repeat methyltransferase
LLKSKVGAAKVTPPANQRKQALEQSLLQAQRFIRSGQLQEAQAIYKRVLLVSPHNPDALHFSGLVDHFLGDHQRAVTLMLASIKNMPGQGWPWNNLGRVYLAMDRRQDALQAFVRCIKLDPSHAEGFCSLAGLLSKAGKLEEALKACQSAVKVKPNYALAWYQLSILHFKTAQFSDGVSAYEKAIQISPNENNAKENVCRTLVRQGYIAQAIKYYQEWSIAQSSNPIVQHHLAALTKTATPSRASDAYIREVFNDFANTFDSKLAQLDYSGPQLVAEFLNQTLQCSPNSLVIGDLGCGTGLCGPMVKRWALQLSGCDLSPRMLEKARQRHLYDELLEQELVQYLLDRPSRFDLLISADTLIYFGDLEPVLKAAKASLCARGRFVFTVEATTAEGIDFQLNSHGRYAHKFEYVQQALINNGYAIVQMTSHDLRTENKQAVQGWLVCAEPN